MTEPIKMIEIFSGIGAQAKALDTLPIPHEVVATMDVEKEAIVSYASMRYDLEKEIANYEFPSKEVMVSELQSKNIGFDFVKQKHSITMKTNIDKVKLYYISDKLSNNLGDVSLQKELPYVDIIFHSSPCQSFSCAGKGEGGDEGSGTTSSLMWESLRLIGTSMPRFIVWENVAAVLSGKHRHNFLKYLERLSEMGYESAFELLNSKNYGVPQNRLRIFCVSRKIEDESDRDTTTRECKSSNKQVINTMKEIRENHPNIKIWEGFIFPEPILLTTRLKDILEHNVDEKYYLPDDRIEKILNSSFMQEKKRIQTTDVCDTLLARDWKDPKCVPVEEPQVKQLGNICPTKTRENPNQGRVYDKEGIAPALTTMEGGNREPMVIEQEPFIVASRGRNPENPSDRTTGTPTEQRLEPNFSGTTNCLTSVAKDNYVCEPQVLRAERTEYGKAIRKQYEAGEIDEKIGNMREMKPRIDGVSNTITTVLKDNYVAEPIIYDDYNSRIPQDQDAITTLTTNCGASAERNGVKIIEPVVCEERKDEGLRFFKDDCVGTLRTIDACGDKRVLEPEIEEERPKIRWRIRKLVPVECWKLMAFTIEDCNRASKFVSNSALYKQAGNSIVVNVLIAIMSSLFIEDGHKAEVWTKYILDIPNSMNGDNYGEYNI